MRRRPGKQAEQAFTDGVNNIVLGRDSMDSFDGLVKAWQDGVGTTIKGEYNDAIAAAS